LCEDSKHFVAFAGQDAAEIAALDMLHNRRITVNLMARRERRRIGGYNRRRVRSAEIRNHTRTNRRKRNKSHYSAFTNALR
jgi:hypothetical protein